MRLIRFGEYVFPEQIELSDNFRDLVQRTIRLPGKDGGYRVYGDRSSPGEIGNIRTSFWLEPEDPNDLQLMVDEVGVMRTFGMQQLVARERNGVATRWCRAEVSNIQLSENVRDMPHKRQRVTVNFQTDDPYWYKIGTEAGGLWGDGFWGDGEWGTGGVAQALSGTFNLFTLDNDGTAVTYPRIVISTGAAQTASAIYIQNITGGVLVDAISWTGTIGPNTRLEINCRALSVRLNNSFAYSSLFGFVNPNFFKLLPGENQLRVYMGAASDAATFTFYYFERFA